MEGKKELHAEGIVFRNQRKRGHNASVLRIRI